MTPADIQTLNLRQSEEWRHANDRRQAMPRVQISISFDAASPRLYVDSWEGATAAEVFELLAQAGLLIQESIAAGDEAERIVQEIAAAWQKKGGR